MKCTCPDRSHETGMALWHRAYCAWYGQDRSGHHRRAAAWAWVADRLARFA